MGRLIDADKLKEFFFSETSGKEDTIRGLMDIHDLDYANDINEDAIVAFAGDLLQAVQNVIDTEPTAFDRDKVLKELDKASDYYESNEQGMERVQMLRLVDAIDIVKGSGLDKC